MHDFGMPLRVSFSDQSLVHVEALKGQPGEHALYVIQIHVISPHSLAQEWKKPMGEVTTPTERTSCCQRCKHSSLQDIARQQYLLFHVHSTLARIQLAPARVSTPLLPSSDISNAPSTRSHAPSPSD